MYLPVAMIILHPLICPDVFAGPALTERDSGSYIIISTGQRFNLSLGSSPSTGYVWHIQELDRSVADVSSSTWEASDPQPGSGGWSNWTFEGKKDGETTLRLTLGPSGQAPGPAASEFRLHIVVGVGNAAANVAFLAAVALAMTLVAELARRRREKKSAFVPEGRHGLARGLWHPRISGMMGVGGILTVIVALLAAMAVFPRFSLWDSNMSDLGVISTAPLFNWGLISCGVLGVFLALGAGLHHTEGKWFRLAWTAILTVAMALLAAIGVFTEAFGLVHFYIAVAFSSIFGVASLVPGISFANDPEYRKLGILALISAALGVAAWFLPSGEGIAIPELVAAAPGLAWLGLLGFRMAKTAAKCDAMRLPCWKALCPSSAPGC
jgi:hypothetical membrane protein/predicted secreted protein